MWNLPPNTVWRRRIQHEKTSKGNRNRGRVRGHACVGGDRGGLVPEPCRDNRAGSLRVGGGGHGLRGFRLDRRGRVRLGAVGIPRDAGERDGVGDSRPGRRAVGRSSADWRECDSVRRSVRHRRGGYGVVRRRRARLAVCDGARREEDGRDSGGGRLHACRRSRFADGGRRHQERLRSVRRRRLFAGRWLSFGDGFRIQEAERSVYGVEERGRRHFRGMSALRACGREVRRPRP